MSPERIGPYRVIRPLGRGGSSALYEAERADGQFVRRVAVKVLDDRTPEARRRFRQERRLLGSLDHPAVARLLDAGEDLEVGEYLAMELVEGEPVDAHCKRRSLSVRARLELFGRVCEAVAHAHARLVVHLDLKPANVLVTDDGAVKLLDFGVAQLVEPSEATSGGFVRKALGGFTPSYVAPERFAGEPVTTAADVYSLGLLLAEMVTGRRVRDLEALPPAEMVRAAAETVAPPSTRATGATRRALRGGIDAIVARATAATPAARYPDASALLDDVRRHVAGEAVVALHRPGYRARRWLGRNMLPLALGTAVITVAASGYGAHQAQVTRERDLAQLQARRASENADFLVDIFTLADPDAARGDTVTARELLDHAADRINSRLRDDPLVRASMMAQMSEIYEKLALNDRALALARDVVEARANALPPDHADLGVAIARQATMHAYMNETSAADSLFAQAEPIIRKQFGEASDEFAMLALEVARHRRAGGDVAAAESLLVLALKTFDVVNADLTNVTRAELELGGLLTDLGRAAEGIGYLEAAYTKRCAALEPPHARRAYAALLLAAGFAAVDRHDEAERMYGAALEEYVATRGPDHTDVAETLSGRAGLFTAMGRYEEGEHDYLDAIRISDAALGPTHPNSLVKRANLAACYSSAGNYAQAVAPNREVLAGYIEAVGETHPAVGIVRGNLSIALRMSGALDEAMAEAVRGYEIVREHLGEESLRAANAGLIVATAAHSQGNTAYADSLYAKVHALFAAASSPWQHHVAIEWGRLRFEQGRCDEALPMLIDAHAYLSETRGDDARRARRAAVWVSLCEDAVSASGMSPRTRERIAALRAIVANTHPWLTELPTATP